MRFARSPISLLLMLGSVVTLVAGGCQPARPAVELRASRATLSADGREAPVALSYAISRPATIDLVVLPPSGGPLYLRRAEQRPAGKDFVYLFDGTYPSPDREGERRVLPVGSYRLTLVADVAGVRQEASTEVTITGADTEPPSITDLTASPETISPNFDGQQDAATITYRLSKAARVSVYVSDSRGRKRFVTPSTLRRPGQVREQWDGLDEHHHPLPDGEYALTVLAVDTANNATTAVATVRLASGGRPEARLMSVSFAPRQITTGGILRVQFTVRNTGATVLRTQGPEPGFLYSSYDTYASILNRQFVDRAGVWRVGVDWAGSPSGAVAKYPYRWGLGRELQPGEQTTIEGQIRLEHGPLQDRQAGPPNNRLYFYAGLIQENMAFFDDKVGGTWIEVGY